MIEYAKQLDKKWEELKVLIAESEGERFKTPYYPVKNYANKTKREDTK